MGNTKQRVKGWGSFVLLAIVLTACGGEGQNNNPVAKAPIKIKVAKAALAKERYFMAGSGQVKGMNRATLSTRVMGHVENIPVKVGQKVGKGQLLISLKNSDLKAKKAQAVASILEAKTTYVNAEKDYHRFEALFDKNSASQKELDDMTTRYDMAKARYEAAQQLGNEVDAQFAYANIRAPFNGIVANIHVDEGAMANPGMPLVSMEAPTTLEVEAKIPESKITNVKTGMPAKVFIKALDTTIQGRLTELSTSASFSGGLYLATVVLKKPPSNVLSGMFASVFFPVENGEKIAEKVSVPKLALVKQGQLTGIYTLGPDNRAILRWLRLGESFGDEVEVLSGLTAGEEYILSAEGKLFNGAKVAIQ